MAKVYYIDPIDHISGKLSKKHRTTYNHRHSINGNGEQKNYTSCIDYSNRTASADQIAQRAAFKAVAKMVYERKMNPSTLAQDQVNFKAQSQYRTFNKYLWSFCMAEYTA